MCEAVGLQSKGQGDGQHHGEYQDRHDDQRNTPVRNRSRDLDVAALATTVEEAGGQGGVPGAEDRIVGAVKLTF